MEINDITTFFLLLEGPYRWYVIGGIIVILTAVISRFVFKTIKWFLILAAAAIVTFAIVQYFTPIDLLEEIGDLSESTEATIDTVDDKKIEALKKKLK